MCMSVTFSLKSVCIRKIFTLKKTEHQSVGAFKSFSLISSLRKPSHHSTSVSPLTFPRNLCSQNLILCLPCVFWMCPRLIDPLTTQHITHDKALSMSSCLKTRMVKYNATLFKVCPGKDNHPIPATLRSHVITEHNQSTLAH